MLCRPGEGSSLAEMVDEIALRPSYLKGIRLVPSEVVAISRAAASLLRDSDLICYPTQRASIVFEGIVSGEHILLEVFSDRLMSSVLR